MLPQVRLGGAPRQRRHTLRRLQRRQLVLQPCRPLLRCLISIA